MSMVVEKVGMCQEKLKWWSRRCFGNVTWEIAKKKRQMRKAEDAALNGNNVGLMVKLKEELSSLLVKEEKMWHQQSKTHWMKLGNKNSNHFHNKASHRYRRNQILGLKDSRGVICMGYDNVAG